MLPEKTTQSLAATRFGRTVESAEKSALERDEPGSFSVVIVPSGSATGRLERVRPLTATSRVSTPASSKRALNSAPSAPPTGSTAMLAMPLWASARVRLTPLPPGWSTGDDVRSTAPRSRRSTSTVRSRLGLRVTETITPSPLSAPHSRCPRRTRHRAQSR